jgi:hypothetical protein
MYVGQFARITVSVTGVSPTGTVNASVDSTASLSAIGCTNMPLVGNGNIRSGNCLIRAVTSLVSGAGFINFSYSGDANHIAAGGTPVDEPSVLATPSLNIDLSEAAGTISDAATDGIMILRYLAGFTGDAITNNAIHPSAERTPTDAQLYLSLIRNALDVNADNRLDLAVDGLLIVRYMRGQRMATGLFNGIDVGSVMTTAQIESYLQLLMP